MVTRPVLLCNEENHLLSLSNYSRETYNTLTTWLTDARTLASPNIVIILVGNKKDLDAEREVTFLEASRFAQENGMYTRLLYVIYLSHIRGLDVLRSVQALQSSCAKNTGCIEIATGNPQEVCD